MWQRRSRLYTEQLVGGSCAVDSSVMVRGCVQVCVINGTSIIASGFHDVVAEFLA